AESLPTGRRGRRGRRQGGKGDGRHRSGGGPGSGASAVRNGGSSAPDQRCTGGGARSPERSPRHSGPCPKTDGSRPRSSRPHTATLVRSLGQVRNGGAGAPGQAERLGRKL